MGARYYEYPSYCLGRGSGLSSIILIIFAYFATFKMSWDPLASEVSDFKLIICLYQACCPLPHCS